MGGGVSNLYGPKAEDSTHPAIIQNSQKSEYSNEPTTSVKRRVRSKICDRHEMKPNANVYNQTLIGPPNLNETARVGLRSIAVDRKVKETNAVKRNHASLPLSLIHAKPTTGDWLNQRYIVNNYIMLDVLGQGSYAEVRLSKDRTTDALFAIKVIPKDFLRKKKNFNNSDTYLGDIKREIAIMKKLLHPNVLRLFEVLDDPKVNKLYLVLEYMQRGDLYKILKERILNGCNTKQGQPYFSEFEIWNISRQIVAGLKYLHEQSVIHGDIKPQNVLVCDNGIIKIADFGISRMLQDDSGTIEGLGGTPAFMAPELCSQMQSLSGPMADIWAFGATLYMLLFGQPPFVAGSILALYQKIRNDTLVFPAVAINTELVNLLKHMLDKVTKSRFRLDEVADHIWMRGSHHPWMVNMSDILGRSKDSISSLHKANLSEKVVRATRSHMTPFAAGTLFYPPDSYHDEEAEARAKRIEPLSNQDLFASIGVGINGQVDHQSANENEDQIDDNILATKWGSDVFQIVTEGIVGVDIESGGDSDNDSYSGSVDENCNANDFIIDEGQKILRDLISDANKKPMSTYSATRRMEMPVSEEVARLARFQNKHSGKLANELVCTTNSMLTISDNSSNHLNNEYVGVSNPCAVNAATTSNLSSGLHIINKTHSRKSALSLDDESVKEISMDTFMQIMDTLSPPSRRFSPGGNEPRDELSDSDDDCVFDSFLGVDEQESFSENSHIRLRVATCSSVGGRETQEDRFVSHANIFLEPSLSELTLKSYKPLEIHSTIHIRKVAMAAIFDGHSGSESSSFLAHHISSSILTAISDGAEFGSAECAESVRLLFARLDKELIEKLSQTENTSGSTAVVAVFDGARDTLMVASVGDSICAMGTRLDKNSARAGQGSAEAQAVTLVRMHRVNDDRERRRVVAAGGIVLNNRVNGILALTRAFGDIQFKYKQSEHLQRSSRLNEGCAGLRHISQIVTVEPEIKFIDNISLTAEFVLLASDGLWDAMSTHYAIKFISKRLTSKLDLRTVARLLVKKALSRGSVDNVTVTILHFY